jgi:hypothetical protein
VLRAGNGDGPYTVQELKVANLSMLGVSASINGTTDLFTPPLGE